MSDTKSAIDKAWWETSEAYHDTIKAGQADPDLSWKAYCLGQLRSAYYLYVDSIEETK